MDFVTDTLTTGRRIRCLTIVDECSRECPGLHTDSSITGVNVAEFLDQLAQTRGLPSGIRTDNGPECVGTVLDQWAHDRGIQLDFIALGKPVQNASIESFTGRLRDECLNQNLFLYAGCEKAD